MENLQPRSGVEMFIQLWIQLWRFLLPSSPTALAGSSSSSSACPLPLPKLLRRRRMGMAPKASRVADMARLSEARFHWVLEATERREGLRVKAWDMRFRSVGV